LRQIGVIQGTADATADAVAYALSRKEAAVKTLALLGVAEGILDRLGRNKPRPVQRPSLEDD